MTFPSKEKLEYQNRYERIRSFAIDQCRDAIEWCDMDASIAPAFARALVENALVILLDIPKAYANKRVMEDDAYDILANVPGGRHSADPDGVQFRPGENMELTSHMYYKKTGTRQFTFMQKKLKSAEDGA